MDINALLSHYGPQIADSIQFEITRYAMGTLAVLVGIWFIASHFIKGRKIRKPANRKRQLRQIRMELKNSASTIVVVVILTQLLMVHLAP